MSAFQIKWQFFFFWSQIKFSDWNQTNSDSNGQNIKHSQHPGHHRSLFGGDKRLSTTGKTQYSNTCLHCRRCVSCNVRCCVCRGGRHCGDKYDQNRERTKVAEGCFFFLAQVGEGEGDWRDFILVWGGEKNDSLSNPKACCVIVLPVILDLNPCLYLWHLYPPYSYI